MHERILSRSPRSIHNAANKQLRAGGGATPRAAPDIPQGQGMHDFAPQPSNSILQSGRVRRIPLAWCRKDPRLVCPGFRERVRDRLVRAREQADRELDRSARAARRAGPQQVSEAARKPQRERYKRVRLERERRERRECRSVEARRRARDGNNDRLLLDTLRLGGVPVPHSSGHRAYVPRPPSPMGAGVPRPAPVLLLSPVRAGLVVSSLMVLVLRLLVFVLAHPRQGA